MSCDLSTLKDRGARFGERREERWGLTLNFYTLSLTFCIVAVGCMQYTLSPEQSLVEINTHWFSTKAAYPFDRCHVRGNGI